MCMCMCICIYTNKYFDTHSVFAVCVFCVMQAFGLHPLRTDQMICVQEGKNTDEEKTHTDKTYFVFPTHGLETLDFVSWKAKFLF